MLGCRGRFAPANTAPLPATRPHPSPCSGSTRSEDERDAKKRHGHVTSVATLDSYRKHGLATKLMRASSEHAACVCCCAEPPWCPFRPQELAPSTLLLAVFDACASSLQ